MMDLFLLKAGHGCLYCLLSLMLKCSCNLVSAKLFPLHLTTKWSFYFIVCCHCILCTSGRGHSTSNHQSHLHWLLPTILVLFGWHAFWWVFSPPLTILPFIPHPSCVEEPQSLVPMSLLVTGTQTAVPLILLWHSTRIATYTAIPSQERYDVATSFPLCCVQRKFTFPLAATAAIFFWHSCAFLNILRCSLFAGDSTHRHLLLVFSTLCWIMAESEPPQSDLLVSLQSSYVLIFWRTCQFKNCVRFPTFCARMTYKSSESGVHIFYFEYVQFVE